MGWNKHKVCQATGSMTAQKMQAKIMPAIGRVQFVQKNVNKTEPRVTTAPASGNPPFQQPLPSLHVIPSPMILHQSNATLIANR